MKLNRYMVFDVESVGLHGEAFAVAWVVGRIEGKVFIRASEGFVWCQPAGLRGNATSHEWVREHCNTDEWGDWKEATEVLSPRDLRSAFWYQWQVEKTSGTRLVADCPWPVEARFLAACVDEDHISREWGGPYPLIDVETVRFAAGLDLDVVSRRYFDLGELPEHNPIADARQSARLLAEALALCDEVER